MPLLFLQEYSMSKLLSLKNLLTNSSYIVVNFMYVVFSDFTPIFLLTKRGNLSIQVGTYRFNRVSSKGPKYRWRCSKNPFGCRATLYTLENKIIRFERRHNH